jgi:aldose 1-epimerase
MTMPDASAMACFPLVPYSNRIRGGRFTFAGRPVSLPVASADPNFEHGHGWRRPWMLECRTPSGAVVRYRHDADAWPWSYEAEQEIGLEDGALFVRLTLRNLSPEPMPAGFGLHPYFPASPAARIETGVRGMWEVDAQVLPTRHVDLPGAPRSIEVAAAELDNVFTGWSRHARIVWPERGLALDLEAEAPLDFLVLYTPQGENFFCCEPVSNATDAFNLASEGVRGTGLLALEPGVARSAAVRFVPRAAETSQS